MTMARRLAPVLVLALVAAVLRPAALPAEEPAPGPTQEPAVEPAGPEAWRDHLVQELLPYWDQPAAYGTPVGNFPTHRCRDGSLPGPEGCEGVVLRHIQPPNQSVVALSRQIYSYGVAFHMTGELRYLDLARSGLDHLFSEALDPETGLFFLTKNLETGAWSPPLEARAAHAQAYGLLGPSMVYYLTRDPELLARIAAIRAAIDRHYRDPATGAFKWTPGDDAISSGIAGHLDQLNAHQYLLAISAPGALGERWRAEALQTARHIRAQFYDAQSGLFRTASTAATGTLRDIRFGLSGKASWYLHLIGRAAGDGELAGELAHQAETLFQHAFVEATGSWATGYGRDGTRNELATWWVYAELNQLAATLAPTSPAAEARLERAFAFWREHFVDHAAGGVWWSVEPHTGAPRDSRKHETWKAGYHAFEHALVGYLSAARRAGTPAELYFAQSPAAFTLGTAYSLEPEIVSVENILVGAPSGRAVAVQRVLVK